MRADAHRPLRHALTPIATARAPRALLALAAIAVAFAVAPDAALAATANDLGHCGGYGQRACCLNEAVPSCDSGLSETGAIGGWCPGILAAFPAGTCGGASANSLSFCGGNGQRACCVGESPLVEPCDSGNKQLIDEIGGTCQYPALAPGASAGKCWTPTPCGGEGQRACSFFELAELGRLTSCNSGLIELGGCDDFACGPSSGWCYRPTACGGDGQRACCVADLAGSSAPEPCNEGLEAVLGVSGDSQCGGLGDLIGNGTNAIHTCADIDSLVDTDAASGERFPASIAEPDLGWRDLMEEPDECAEELPPRGYADLHAHMFAHLAHGGGVLAGEPYPDGEGETIDDALRQDFGSYLPLEDKHGDPVGDVRDLFFQDLLEIACDTTLYPDCDKEGFRLFHGDHLLDHLLGAGTMEGPPGLDCFIESSLIGCGAPSSFGSPLFNGWPTWRSTTHQQMYYRWLERAWRGGLRLMVQLAVTNEALCRNSKKVPDVDCNDEMAPVDLQIDAAYEFEQFVDDLHNGDGWFRIVQDPEEARHAIEDGKLAVVLGIEVANLFSCKKTGCLFEGEGGRRRKATETEPAETNEAYITRMVEEYYDKGIRVVFPIHNFENAFGAPATWQDAIHAGNWVSEGAWWAPEDCSGAGYGFELGSFLPFVVNLFAFGQLAAPPDELVDFVACNQNGLTPLGEHMIAEMMETGMIIDVDHMSRKALDATMQFRCKGELGVDRQCRRVPAGQTPAADELPAPVIASHVQFFDLNTQAIRHERMRTKAQLEKIRDSGGMIAAMLKDDKQDTLDAGPKFNVAYASSPSGKVIADDCRQSSKTFAQMYQYSVDVMRGPVALGSDWNGVAGHVGPRFGFEGCGRNSNERGKQERAGNKLTYPFSLPGFGEFGRQVTGMKTFDYNFDGLAHVGLLPDLVADLGRIGLSQKDLEPLFGSATGFVDVWDRAEGEVPAGSLFDQLHCVDYVGESALIADATCKAGVTVAAEDTLDAFGNALQQSPAGPYSLGTTSVTLSTTQTTACGTTPSPCTASVTVVDDTSPTITCPSLVSTECNPVQPKKQNADGTIEVLDLPPGTLASFGSPVAGTDNCGPAWLEGCDRPQSDWFPFGMNSVSCYVRDQAVPEPNTGSCSFAVNVVDTTPPTITCPASVSAECTGGRSATVTPGTATGSDVCAPLQSLSTHPTQSFPRGDTTLTYTATDHVNLTASCTQTVTVVDTEPPTISCPATKTAECTGSSSAFVTADPASGSDVCAGVEIANPAAASFPMGQTTISYTATDEVDLTASCTSGIVVEDTTPPTITCPNTIVAECQGGRAATLTPGVATGQDICAGVDVSGHDEASFPLGTTTLSYTAEDEVGLDAMCTGDIEVVDTTAPVIVCPAPVAMEPDDLTCGVTFTGAPTTVTDVCDPTPAVTSSVPVPATFIAIGDHTITFTATDQSGNATSCDWKVTVLPTSLCQKREAIDSLESLLAIDTGDQNLIEAIDHLHVSVGEFAPFGTTVQSNPSVWGDPTHVDTCNDGVNGEDVFRHEEEACTKLDLYVKDSANASFGFGAALEAVRKSLAAADRRLAQTAIEDATANGGKASQISQAATSSNKGDAEAAKGGAAICRQAIPYYFDAWDKALKAWCPQD